MFCSERIGDWIRGYLRALFAIQLEKGFATIEDLSKKVRRSYSRCFHVLARLEREGFIEKIGEKQFTGSGGKGKLKGSTPTEYVLTEKGRKNLTVVLTGGTFDIIHEGHLATLTEANRLGDFLVVVIARNETVRRLKGREPINDEKVRLYIVSNLRPVDMAILGDREDPYAIVKRVKPDIIALGYDQKHRKNEIVRKLRELGLTARVVRLSVKMPEVKTSRIISQILKTL